MLTGELGNDESKSEVELDNKMEVVIFPLVPMEVFIVKMFVEFDGW